MNRAEQGSTAEQVSRPRNRRGEGGRLRAEILDAAVALVERTGSAEGVTLRSVAREIGIAAPSIYAHFADRDEILGDVRVRGFDELRDEVLAAKARQEDPVRALVAGCTAYVEFGLRRPALYHLLFGGVLTSEAPVSGGPGREPDATGGAEPEATGAGPATDPRAALRRGREAFETLVDGVVACVRDGRSTSTDPFTDAVALWSALHGHVSLRTHLRRFPWPPLEPAVHLLVCRLAGIS